MSQRRKITKSICVSSSGLTGRYILRSRHCRRLHLCRNLLPNAEAERLKAVTRGRRSRRRPTDEVAKLGLLRARLVGDCHHCDTPGCSCIFNGFNWPGTCSWLVGAIACLMPSLITREAQPLVLLALGLSALGCSVALAVAVDACHICTASRWHGSGGAIGQLGLTSTTGPLLKATSCAAACRRKAPCLHEGEHLNSLLHVKAVKRRVDKVFFIWLLTVNGIPSSSIWPL